MHRITSVSRNLLGGLLLLAAVAACGEDPVTSPVDEDAADLFVQEPNQAKSSGSVIVPDLFFHRRYFADEGIVRECQINPLEDLDGNDRRTVQRSGASHTVAHELDGFVAIREARVASNPGNGPVDYETMWVGRATWSLSLWQAASGDITSVVSQVQGVVALIDPSDPPAGLTADQGSLTTVDLDPASPGNDIDVINSFLADADELQGVDCSLNFTVFNQLRINDVSFTKSYPKSLDRLF